MNKKVKYFDEFLNESVEEAEIIIARDKEHLEQLIEEGINKFGNEADLNYIDVSNITNMSGLFSYTKFNGDIGKWDVSNVTNIGWMFKESEFNGDISNWDVSNVISLRWLFDGSLFDNDISNWKISDNCNTADMFEECNIKYYYKPIKVLIREFNDKINESKKEIVSTIKENPIKMKELLDKIPKSEAKLYNYIETMLRTYDNDRDDFDTVSNLNDIGF